MFIKVFLLFFLIKLKAEKLETLQYVNNIKEKAPVKIFIFFFKDQEFFNNFKKNSMENFLEIIKDLSYFYYLNENFFLLPPEKIELVNGQVSRKLLLHNSESLVGIGMFIISFNGSFKRTLFIPGDGDIKKNLLFIIETNNILVKNGILSTFEIDNIINKIKKS